MSPTQLSLAKLRKEGFAAEVVEKWIPGAFIRKDFLGCIDILAVKAQHNGVLGIQATTTGNINARLEKARMIPALRAYLEAGNRFVVWGWAKRGPRGKRKVWELKEEALTFNDL